MDRAELHALVDAWEADPGGLETCDNLCTVLDALPGQPEGEYTADEIRELIDESEVV